jgi:hypothetical protein
MPRVENGRRPAGYYFRARTRAGERQLPMLADEQFEELTVVNQVRAQVRQWRAAGYPGATPVTRQLLAHWTQPEREQRLFFCQLEVAETIIWPALPQRLADRHAQPASRTGQSTPRPTAGARPSATGARWGTGCSITARGRAASKRCWPAARRTTGANSQQFQM